MPVKHKEEEANTPLPLDKDKDKDKPAEQKVKKDAFGNEIKGPPPPPPAEMVQQQREMAFKRELEERVKALYLDGDQGRADSATITRWMLEDFGFSNTADGLKDFLTVSANAEEAAQKVLNAVKEGIARRAEQAAAAAKPQNPLDVSSDDIDEWLGRSGQTAKPAAPKQPVDPVDPVTDAPITDRQKFVNQVKVWRENFMAEHSYSDAMIVEALNNYLSKWDKKPIAKYGEWFDLGFTFLQLEAVMRSDVKALKDQTGFSGKPNANAADAKTTATPPVQPPAQQQPQQQPRQQAPVSQFPAGGRSAAPAGSQRSKREAPKPQIEAENFYTAKGYNLDDVADALEAAVPAEARKLNQSNKPYLDAKFVPVIFDKVFGKQGFWRLDVIEAKHSIDLRKGSNGNELRYDVVDILATFSYQAKFPDGSWQWMTCSTVNGSGEHAGNRKYAHAQALSAALKASLKLLGRPGMMSDKDAA